MPGGSVARGRRPQPRRPVLDQLHLDGTQPETTIAADAILRESGSPYTLPGLISGLDEVISQLTRATRQALADVNAPGHQAPANR